MEKLIKTYGLLPHPEGGYYKEIYRSDTIVTTLAAGEKRNAATHIYFLLLKGQVSKFHKVLHDEIWNFYEGSPLRLVKYDLSKVQEEKIGPGHDSFVSVVRGGCFQAAEPTGDFSFVGCTVAPGFEFDDFSFLNDDPELARTVKQNHPDLEKFI